VRRVRIELLRQRNLIEHYDTTKQFQMYKEDIVYYISWQIIGRTSKWRFRTFESQELFFNDSIRYICMCYMCVKFLYVHVAVHVCICLMVTAFIS